MGMWNRLRATLGGDGKRDEIANELQFHLEMRVEEYIASGMSPEEARREAQRKLGNRASMQDETHDRDVFGWLDTLSREARHAWRNLKRRPSFTLVAVASLGLGIGANTAIFGVIDSVLLKPLPFEAAERIYAVEERKGATAAGGNPQRVRDYAAQAKSLDSIAGFYGDGLLIQNPNGERQRVQSIRFIGDLPRVLRLKPALGRSFTAAELRGEGTPVAWISNSMWKARFGGQQDLSRMRLTAKQGVFEIVGILPPGITYPENSGDVVWSPDQSFQTSSRKAGWLTVVGRLSDGSTQAASEAEFRVITAQLATQYPDSDSGLSATLRPLREVVAGEARTPLFLLMATVAAVLLIACFNLSGLLLARGMERQREASIRAAIGAGRGSLVRLFLMESLLLSLLGSLAGIVLAWWGVDYLKDFAPADVPGLQAARLDLRVLTFTLAISFLSALIFGLIPAWRSSRVSLASGTRIHGPAASRNWLRGGMSVAQVAMSLVLLILTGLLARGLVNLRQRPLGFASPGQIVTMRVPFSWDTPSAAVASFTTAALEGLSRIPGVRAAGVVDRPPLTGGTQTRKEIRFRGGVQPPAQTLELEYGFRGVSPEYFQGMGIPLLAGQMLEPWRSNEKRHLLLVNDAFVRRYFAGSNINPVGIQLSLDKDGDKWWEIAGVIGNVPAEAQEIEPRAEVFTHIQETGWPLLSFTLRTEGEDPRSVIAPARKVLQDLEPTVIPEARLMSEVVEETWRKPSLMLTWMGGFAACALLLAAIGIYGLLAGEVSARTSEIGVRLALGATQSDILKATLTRGAWIALGGAFIGAALSWLVSSKVQGLTFGVSSTDGLALGGATAILALAAGLASYLPARRASRVDPVIALRHD